jgi:hypothetical protein
MGSNCRVYGVGGMVCGKLKAFNAFRPAGPLKEFFR